MVSTDPHHPSLRLHKIKSLGKDYSAISINYDFRIILTFIFENKGILLLDIGTHDEVYL